MQSSVYWHHRVLLLDSIRWYSIEAKLRTNGFGCAHALMTLAVASAAAPTDSSLEFRFDCPNSSVRYPPSRQASMVWSQRRAPRMAFTVPLSDHGTCNCCTGTTTRRWELRGDAGIGTEKIYSIQLICRLFRLKQVETRLYDAERCDFFIGTGNIDLFIAN